MTSSGFDSASADPAALGAMSIRGTPKTYRIIKSVVDYVGLHSILLTERSVLDHAALSGNNFANIIGDVQMIESSWPPSGYLCH
jgi:hypothetical protein